MPYTTISKRTPVWIVVGFLLGCVGCGKPVANVKGTVFYEGSPVKGGMIVFFSVENGADPPGRSTIASDGTYHVQNMDTGKKRILVAGPRVTPAPSEATDRLPPPEPDYPDHAVGNNGIQDFAAGNHVHDVQLSKPDEKKVP